MYFLSFHIWIQILHQSWVILIQLWTTQSRVLYKETPTSFLYMIYNGTPFTYLVKNFASTLTALNALHVFQRWITHISRKYSCLFHIHKVHLLALLGPFTDQNGRFLHLFIYFNWWIPTILYTCTCFYILVVLAKGPHFRVGLPCMGYDREYSGGGGRGLIVGR